MAAASTREIIEYEVGKAADEIYRHIDIPNYVDHSVPEAQARAKGQEKYLSAFLKSFQSN